MSPDRTPGVGVHAATDEEESARGPEAGVGDGALRDSGVAPEGVDRSGRAVGVGVAAALNGRSGRVLEVEAPDDPPSDNSPPDDGAPGARGAGTPGTGGAAGAAPLVVGKASGRERKPEDSGPAGRCIGTAANSLGGAGCTSGARWRPPSRRGGE